MNKKEIYFKVKNMILEGNIEESSNICMKCELKNNEDLMGKIFELLIKKDFNFALEFSKKLEFKNYVSVQSQIIKKMILDGRYNEALKLCENENLSAEQSIIGMKVKCLTELEKYDEVYNIKEDTRFFNSEFVQIQIMRSLLKQREYDEFEKIGLRKSFENSQTIQMEMIKYYILCDNYDAANNILQNFNNCKSIKKFYNKCLENRKNRKCNLEKYKEVLLFTKRLRKNIYFNMQICCEDKVIQLWDKLDTVLDKIEEENDEYVLNLYNKYFK